VFACVDSWIGLLLRRWIADYLGATSTTPRAAAIALVLVLAGLVAAWAAGRRRLPSALRRGSALAVVLVLVVGLSAVGSAWWSWKDSGGFYLAYNKGATAYGLELGRLTAPGARIAVVWAGAPIYYAHRDGVDMLGKMDPHIAHEPHHPGAPMYPGHDKFDLDWSIGHLRPDVVAQYAWFTNTEVDHMVAEGYRPMWFAPHAAPGLSALQVPRALLWVRDGSDLVHRSELVPVPLATARARTVEWSGDNTA
jgi:hypothetical protein